MAGRTTILIADDHPLLRRGLRQTIELDPEFEVIGEAANGVEALRLIEEKPPQIAVVDLNMPQMGGFDLMSEIQKRKLELAVIFLTMHKEKEIFNKAMGMGAQGYLLKDSALDEIIDALKSVIDGRPFISSPLYDYLLRRRERINLLAEQVPSLNDLTPTERRVLKLIADYKTSKEIADILHIHYRTVENHRTNISAKLRLQGSHSLLKFAVEHQEELS